MANNRMQFYCKKCLKFILIAKYYPCEWYCQNDDENPISNFLFEHKICYESNSKIDPMIGTGCFGLRTEADNDDLISDYEKKILISKKSL